MQADSAVEEVSIPELSVEEAWGGAEGPASIAELALEQRGVHFPLVQHHCLLASLLHAAMTFSLKVKPLSLFDGKVRRGCTHTHTVVNCASIAFVCQLWQAAASSCDCCVFWVLVHFLTSAFTLNHSHFTSWMFLTSEDSELTASVSSSTFFFISLSLFRTRRSIGSIFP